MSAEQPITQRDVEALRTTLDKLDTTITKFQEAVEVTYVRKDVNDLELDAIRARIDMHDGWLLWAQRIVIGGVIAALLAVALAGR